MLRSLCAILGISALGSQAADVTVRPALNFSKSFGGSGSDTGSSVAVDASGNVYVAGTTDSMDFPIASALQPTIGGPTLRMTADGGKLWTSTGIPRPVYSVAGSPATPATLFAGTSSGIFKSADSGKTWTALASAGTAAINAVLVDSVVPTTVYAATASGLLKSADGGATWRSTGPAGNGLALAANPAQAGTVVAAFDGTPTRPNLYRTSDGGATWTALSNSPAVAIAIAFDPATPNLLYAISSTTGFNSGGVTSVWKSLDGGDSWTKLTAPAASVSTFALAAGAGKVYVGTANGLQVSGDGGLTWKSAAGVTGTTGNVAVDPEHPQSVYADGDGIFASADGGTTWSRISALRQVVETIAVLPTVPSMVVVGAKPGRNVLVTKWSGDGKQMFYSTYLGGSYNDAAAAIAVDRQGNAYVVGETASTDFPVTAGAIQSVSHGPVNAFLAKISPDGKSLLYSTYLGGSGADAAYAVAVDDTGNAYLAGTAGSSDFPVTAGAFQTHKQKSCAVNSATTAAIQSAAFVSKIGADGSGLRYSTFLGGSCPDLAAAIAIDGSGSAYVVGATGSEDFPVTQGSVQPKWGRGSVSGFLTKLTPQGNGLVYSTFLGGQGQDVADGIAVDAKGAAYVAGGSWGLDQPTYAPSTSSVASPSAIFPNANGVGFGVALGGAAYVMKVDATGSARLFLKYLGGTFGYGKTLALDPSANVWVAGYFSVTGSTERFPMLHPFQAGTGSAFITELAPDGQTLLFSSAMESVNQVAVDSSGNTFVTGWSLLGVTPTGAPKSGDSVQLTRIDGAVTSAVTVEDPRRLAPGWNSPLDYGIAGGEFLVLTGSGLGPAAQLNAQAGQDGKLLTSLGGTTVTFGGVPAPLISVQADKIVCIAPFSVTSKGATLQIQSGASLSNSIKLPAATTAIEPLATTNQDGALNTPGHPAPPGSIVTVYVAGFGQTTPASVDGLINDNIPRQMIVTSTLGVQIAGQNAQILYAGPAPGEVAGVSQINFRVPQLPAGTYTANIGWGPSTATRPFLGDYNSISLTVGQP